MTYKEKCMQFKPSPKITCKNKQYSLNKNNTSNKINEKDIMVMHKIQYEIEN